VWSYLFFAYHRVGLSLFAIIVAALAATGGAVMMWLVSWIPGIPGAVLPVWLWYAVVVNIGYVHRKETVEVRAGGLVSTCVRSRAHAHRVRPTRAKTDAPAGSTTSTLAASRTPRLPWPREPHRHSSCSRCEESEQRDLGSDVFHRWSPPLPAPPVPPTLRVTSPSISQARSSIVPRRPPP